MNPNQSINQSINKITLALAISIGTSLFSSAVWAATWTLSGNNNGNDNARCEGQNSCNSLKSLLEHVNDGDTINLTGSNTFLARSEERDLDNSKFEINKRVIINGNGNTLRINASDISLGNDVEINNVNLQAVGYSRGTAGKLFSNNATDTANIYLNGNKLTLNNVTTEDSRSNLAPNIIVGAMQGKNDAGRGELIITGSENGKTKFANIVAGSPSNPSSTATNSVKITLTKDVLTNDGKVYLGNGKHSNPSAVTSVNLTINSAGVTLIRKIEQDGNDRTDLTLNKVNAGSGEIPLNKLTNLTLNGSEATLGESNITGTLTLTNSKFNVKQPDATLLDYSDDEDNLPAVNTTINNINSTDTTSEINVLNPKINLTISKFTGSTLPKFSERDPGASIISLPNGYNSQTDRAGNITITPPSSTTETVEPAPSPAPAPATPPKTEEPKQNEPSPKPSEGEQSGDQSGEVNEQGQNNNNSPARSENRPENSDSSASNSSSASGSSNNDSPTGQGGDGATMQPNAGAGTPSTTPEANPGTSQPNGSSPSGSETPAGSKETENQSGSDTGQDDQATRQEDPQTSVQGNTHSSAENGGKKSADEPPKDSETPKQTIPDNNSQGGGNAVDTQSNPQDPPKDAEKPKEPSNTEGQATPSPQPAQPAGEKPKEDTEPKKPETAEPAQPSEQPAAPPAPEGTPPALAPEKPVPPKPEQPATPPKPAAPVAPVAPAKPAEPSAVNKQIFQVIDRLTQGLNDKEKQEVANKTEQSLRSLAEGYSNYDFAFSIDATRVA
ncbi:hypothetical protein GVX76_08525, partial [[Haemophilus] felis]|nr:hypothetical protein [[Haemophilus] felis]